MRTLRICGLRIMICQRLSGSIPAAWSSARRARCRRAARARHHASRASCRGPRTIARRASSGSTARVGILPVQIPLSREPTSNRNPNPTQTQSAVRPCACAATIPAVISWEGRDLGVFPLIAAQMATLRRHAHLLLRPVARWRSSGPPDRRDMVHPYSTAVRAGPAAAARRSSRCSRARGGRSFKLLLCGWRWWLPLNGWQARSARAMSSKRSESA